MIRFPSIGMKWVLVPSIGVALLGLSCNESLPPSVDPSHAIDVKMNVQYAYSNTENAVHVDFTVTNRFDETLQARAAVFGTGIITLKRDTSRHRTYLVSVANVLNGYNSATGMVTIDPGQSIHVLYVWNFVDDVGRDFRTTVFTYYPDTTCLTFGRMIAFNETFTVTGSIRIFDKLPTITVPPRELSMCHVNKYVLQNYCPIIDPNNPCP